MLLFCQEFELLCVLRLWDTLMSAEGPALTQEELLIAGGSPNNQEDFKIQRFEFMDFVAVALVQRVRKQILDGQGDFANVMDALQVSSTTVKTLADIDELINSSKRNCLQWLRWLLNRGSGKKMKKRS